jgi:hypothetical protein
MGPRPKFIEGGRCCGTILPAGKLVIYKNLPDRPQKAVLERRELWPV